MLNEIGYLDPEWIAGHAQEFIELLNSKNNRLVWGGMIAPAFGHSLARGGSLFFSSSLAEASPLIASGMAGFP
jgi:hypothetical protein